MKNSNFPVWLTIISLLFLFWNFFGILNFYNQANMSPNELSDLPIVQQDFISNTPLWSFIAFGVAVIGGFIGCGALLFRKKIANIFLQLSLIGIVIQMYHNFILANGLEVYGADKIAIPVMVIIFAIFLIWLANYATKKQWID